MPVAVILCPQAQSQVSQQAGTTRGTLVGLARTMPAHFFPPSQGRGQGSRNFGFTPTGGTGFYEGCIGRAADVITHQPSLALWSPHTPK